MANKKISQLPAATTVNNADLLVLEQNGTAKKLTGTLLLQTIEAHGGIASTSYTAPVAPSLEGTLTLTYADGTTTDIPIYNGAQGVQGEQGIQGYSPVATVEKVGHTSTITITDANGTTTASVTDGQDGYDGEDGNPGYCWIKWSAEEPTSDSYLSDIPDAWMGVYSGTSATAPTAYTAYSWYEVKGATGAAGADGDPGERGTWIWQATAEPIQIGNDYFISRSSIASSNGQTGTPRQGDMVWFNNTYYYVVTFNVLRDAYQVSRGYTFTTANVPSGGSTGYRLVKASDTDYDATWDSPEVFYATYGSTSSNNILSAAEAGKFVVLKNTTETQTLDSIYDYCPLVSVSVRYNSSDPAERLPVHRVAAFARANVDGTIYWATATWALGQLTDTWAQGTISASGGGTPYDSTPSALGTASAGVSSDYSRGDHVHAMPTASQVGAVATAQGTSHAGEFLVVGSDGNVTTVTMTAWQGGSY